MNTEVLLPSYLKLLELVVKLSKQDQLETKDMKEVSELKEQLKEHIEKRKIR